jgi:DNA helicase-2/ATP-dependent DNA helicase PcrA
MIDEYQDTNNAQYLFVKLLSQKYKNLCVVGDDDQGIYAWRGADIKNIQSFEKDFENVNVVKLEQNYRSTANVINAAVAVIKQNSARVDKSLWTDKGEGDQISVFQARDQEDETQYVIDEIQLLKSKGVSLTNMAVLYRTNFQSRVIEEAMLNAGLPYKLVGGFRFYDRKEIKDILSYLRFIYNLKDELSLNRILNTPIRKVGPKTVANLYEIARECECTVGQLLVGSYEITMEKPKTLNISSQVYKKIEENIPNLGKFTNLIKTFGSIYTECMHIDVLSCIDTILNRIDYIRWIDDGSEAAQYKKENIEELKNVASRYVQRYPENSLEMFLQEVNLIEQEQDKNQDGSGSSINLMTLHSSKGLDFDYVFIIGMEEGILPHSRSFTDENGLEEERRLCYVGITRAREKLYLTFADQRLTRDGFNAQIPSRFLGEIPQELCEYYSWQL